ncbi:3'(2'),5'-bisphosphate nucleotidase CysQ [Rheinheimera riviphila]|uniref:3'(2'),5'-bisphosphate nucleotidase CysQ n=1 Tax=Rheinheimera riviphila TaxID=1834037 RepID=UPI001F0C5B78|nr:3'(2'),5'-bisphosphate nucleotidase CysQ [Rheinheimera riviphila]
MITPTTQQLADWLPQIRRIAVAAGDAILTIYNQPEAVAVQQKADDSPLTAADLAAHQLIMRELTSLTPDIPVLSEEAADIPWTVRQHWHCYWLVDPLDGTKEFIKRNGEFTVNIALIVAGEPVLGVIHAPVLAKTYSAVLGLGAFVADAKGERQIHAVEPVPGETVRLVGSKSHYQPEVESYLAQFPQHELVAVGSSLKFCMVADGTAHIYPRFGPTMLWDTGAGHAIAVAAGASVQYLGIDGPAYQRENLLNGNFIVKAN